MADHITSLDPMRFVKLGEKRQQAIAAGNGIISEHPANRLANELHPTKQFLVVKEIITQADRCNTYVLDPDTEKGTTKLAYFSAGQYLSVKVEIDGYTHNRPYSLVSSPKESLNGQYAITVKGAENGFVSEYILKNWKVGTPIEVSDPMGSFTYEQLRDAKHIVGIAGGSGITPFVSLAKAIADGDEDCSLTLLCGCRTMADRLFYRELLTLANKCDRLRVIYILSDEEWMGFESGYVSADLIRKYAPVERYSIFICGPRSMHSYLDKEIEKLGVEKKYVRHELYGENLLPELRGLSIHIKVRLNGKEKTITGTTADTILRSLEKNQIPAPARCRSGECGFCRARLIDGNVIIPKESDRRRLADELHGYIHPCCTYPKGDITIEIGADN